MIKDQDYEALCPYQSYTCLLLLPSGFTMDIMFPFTKHFKSHFPATNITHHNEPVTTNTLFSTQLTLGSNTTAVQIFVRCNSKYINVYGVATDCNLSCTLEENIMNQGAMDVFSSNNG